MTSKLELFTAHVESRGWTFERLDDRPVLRIDFDMGWASRSTFVTADEGKFAVSIESRYPNAVPPDRQAAVMEFITRVNEHLDVGGFVFDLDEGTVGFRTSMWLREVALTDPIMANLFDTNTLGYKTYVRALEAVIADEDTIEDAILEAEGRG